MKVKGISVFSEEPIEVEIKFPQSFRWGSFYFKEGQTAFSNFLYSGRRYR